MKSVRCLAGRHLAARRLPRWGASGQGLVEFAIAVPVFMLLLLGMLEFGFAFTHNMTLEYATREGARIGAALANGGGTLGCGLGQSPNAATVDPQIIGSVQRVLTSPGSPIDPTRVTQIRIFKADANGNPWSPGTFYNTWIPGAGPLVNDGNGGTVALQFKQSGATLWDPCSRTNGSTPDSIGVSLVYDYHLITPLGIFLGMTGTPAFSMTDRTVMALNPTS